MGETVVRVSIWLALLGYPAGPLGPALGTVRGRRIARLVWTLGAAFFAVHVASSFHVFYDWSHAVALAETARQVEELAGRGFGAGIYLNYLFTVVWTGDAIWWWAAEADYRRRSLTVFVLMHGFFLFMIFNATVVFESGAVSFVGALVTIAGAAALIRTARIHRVRR
ncbi:MAG: hypothetical protein GTN89_13930 [Acidobacteria bacterium]|nr:hypothetical protein [Acidobacteriota bacterium]NIM60454.1 hypothetical protein [Acidobacteriota bacterium]NIO60365.1 hypothetical protein [Acidobacteriota bacterium]NIQ31437.1 hypothetical protein [Acidobacteriota bacterium]NIQ86681.1 hypothetical protein [Acidobacteriota bacterium]